MDERYELSVVGPAIKIIKKQKYRILYLTSRDENLTDTTRKWLEDNVSFEKTDKLILVESQKSKINILKNYLDKIYLYIDDFKYDYQSGNPKISDHVLPEIKQWNLPFVIFDNDWDDIIKKYF